MYIYRYTGLCITIVNGDASKKVLFLLYVSQPDLMLALSSSEISVATKTNKQTKTSLVGCH